MRLRERVKGSWVLLRASFDYLRFPVLVEDTLYHALVLRRAARILGCDRDSRREELREELLK